LAAFLRKYFDNIHTINTFDFLLNKNDLITMQRFIETNHQLKQKAVQADE